MQGESATALASLATAYDHLIASRCLTFAGFTILVYDHLATLPEEIAQVWSRPKNVVSFLFLLNRYSTPLILIFDLYDKSGLASPLTRSFCRIWLLVEGFLTVVSFSVIHALVAMRVSALHEQSRWIIILLSIAFIAYVTTTMTLVGVGLVPMSYLNQPTVPFNICDAPIPPGMWIVWLPSLFFESLIVVLTIVRVVRYIGCDISTSTPVAYLMYRDGILYFLVMGTNSLLCLLDWTVAPPTLNALAKYFGHAVCVCASSKLVLNLRALGPSNEVYNTTYNLPDSYEPSLVESIRIPRLNFARQTRCSQQSLHCPQSTAEIDSFSDIYLHQYSTSPRPSVVDLTEDGIPITRLDVHAPRHMD